MNTLLHLQRHGDGYVLLPSVVDNGHGLPSVVVDGEHDPLPAVIDHRHGLLLASVDVEHSLLTVLVGGRYVL